MTGYELVAGDSRTMSDDAISASKQQGETVVIETRHGTLEINVKQAIHFPAGVLGMPNMRDFCLVDYPDERLEQFKILQSVNDEKLSFIVLPLALDGELIETSDIEECSRVTGVELADMVVLSIVTVQRTPQDVNISANIRAPIIVDAEQRLGMQYVFSSDKYQICHPLN